MPDSKAARAAQREQARLMAFRGDVIGIFNVSQMLIQAGDQFTGHTGGEAKKHRFLWIGARQRLRFGVTELQHDSGMPTQWPDVPSGYRIKYEFFKLGHRIALQCWRITLL